MPCHGDMGAGVDEDLVVRLQLKNPTVLTVSWIDWISQIHVPKDARICRAWIVSIVMDILCSNCLRVPAM